MQLKSKSKMKSDWKWAEHLIFPKNTHRWPPGTSLMIRERQSKTTRRYQLTPVSTAVINKTRNNKCWRGRGEKGSLGTVGGNVNCAATMENIMEVPQKTGNWTAMWSRNGTSGYLFKENANVNYKRCMHPRACCSIGYHGQLRKQPGCPSRVEWIKKVGYACVHTHTHTHTTERCSARKKNEILSFGTACMEPEGTTPSGVSQRKTNTTGSPLYVNLKT